MTTPEQFGSYLMGAVMEWGPGYWSPSEGPQRKVRLMEDDQGGTFFEVQDLELEADRRYGFEVEIVVRQIFPTGDDKEAS